jgi:hypothetical protein
VRTVEYKDGHLQREVLTGMIVSDEVAGAVAARWKPPGLFGSRVPDLLGGMVVAYHRKYHKAPQRAIANMFDRWAESHEAGEEEVRAAAEFLHHLDSQYNRNGHGPSPEFLKEQSEVLFNLVALRDLRDKIDAALERQDADAGLAAASELRPVGVAADAAYRPADPANDLGPVLADRKGRSLVNYPGALGGFFAHTLERDGFVAFLGEEKGKKSFWQFDVAFRAWRQGRRVAWFVVGDMSRVQVESRLYARIIGRPLRRERKVRHPTRIEAECADVAWDIRDYDEAVTEKQLRGALERHAAKHDPARLMLSVYPRGGVGVGGIRSVLDGYVRDGEPPDVVVVDMADHLDISSTHPKWDRREQIGEAWGELSTLRQELHCLVVTGTQCTREGYGTKTKRREHVSEDKHKLAHVSGMVGINQNRDVERLECLGLNWVAARDLDFDEDKVCYAATCLAAANPACLSTF